LLARRPFGGTGGIEDVLRLKLLCLSKPIVDEYVAVLQRLGLEDERELSELLGLFAHGVYALFTAKTPELHIMALRM
jgi:hypothetical protein